MEDYIKEILNVAGSSRPVSLEVINTTKDKMVEEAKILLINLTMLQITL